MKQRSRFTLAAMIATWWPLAVATAPAAQPTAADALKLKPIQSDVDFETPEATAIDNCTITPYTAGKVSGWEVRNPDGHVLRRFLDTNRDNKVDQWSYFKTGIEVYRDLDTNYNRKADQYRWLGTEGTRWGIDTNEDGQVDRWKVISPEELSAEIVAALRTQDTARFRRLLLSSEELKQLGLGADQLKQMTQRVSESMRGIETLVKQQKFVSSDAQWVNFGGTRPGTVPAGTDGSTQDVEVYENAAAIVQSSDGVAQVLIGTLVRSGDAWRVIDLPHGLSDATADNGPNGFFFSAVMSRPRGTTTDNAGGLSPEVQELVTKLEEIDKDLVTAQSPDQLATLNARRADVVEELARLAENDEDRATWMRQLADTVSAAAQSGGYPDGVARLKALYEQLDTDNADPDVVAYVKFRFLSASYGLSLQDPEADFPEIQQQWLDNLEKFIEEYPASADAPEAMLQLAVAQEFAGQDEAAVKWYGRIVRDFPAATAARKAAGAKRRIECVGQKLALQGKDLDGNPTSLADSAGKVTLIHYWATWCAPCKQDLSLLKDMLGKYGDDKLSLIGINVDNDRALVDAYLAENPLPWPQWYEEGGMDSPLANEMGILTLPTMLLLDQSGKVVVRNLHATDVHTELDKLLP